MTLIGGNLNKRKRPCNVRLADFSPSPLSGMAPGLHFASIASMELRQLKHFVAVGEAGSITAAAKKLRLTQPALSRQIKALEEELDTTLLERGAHSIQFTPAGEVLLAEARKLVKFSDAMIEKVKSTAIGEPLRVGYAPSLAGEFLSIAIERFTQFHPRVRVSLYDWSSAEMKAGLEAGKLDLIVAAPCEGLTEPI
ncbi:MAG: LysR family transcriptional regulator, partial [Verrucomicrobiaceae bacterium]